MGHIPGPWNVSTKIGGTVVSQVPIETDGTDLGHNHKGYYGGYCIAESIYRKADADLISAAPELLSVLEELSNGDYNTIDDPDFWARVELALIKARGEN